MAAAKEVIGVALPANEKGERSSTNFCKEVLAAAVGAVDASGATSVQAEKNFRFGYAPHFMKQALEASKSKDAALAVARAGLARAHAHAEFVRSGASSKLQDVNKIPVTDKSFALASVSGGGSLAETLELPYRGQVLTGDALQQQLDAFATKGVMEPSCAAAAKATVSNPEWANLKGHQFVVLGAGSELGPFELLLKAGATVFALGTRRADRWQKHIALARASAGTLLFPLAPGTDPSASDEVLAAAAGVDLAQDLPEVLAWILNNTDGTRPLTVGTYIYADGEANVRLTLASDVIVQAVASAPRALPASFAWLGSPSTACALPHECWEASLANLANAAWWQRALGYEANNSIPAASEDAHLVHNGIAVIQGPNYALAQQLRAWRAADLVGRGMTVSFNMAPAARTLSVVKNASIKTAMDGMGNFPPMEAFEADTARATMFLLMLSDIRGGSATTRAASFKNPSEYLSDQAFHGGMWRSAYRFESLGRPMYIFGTIWPQR